MSENRRTTTRYDVSIPANLTIDGNAQDLTVSNLSLGGAFVEIAERLAIGTRVEIKFSIPGREEAVGVGGSVRWVAPSGAGIQFDGLRAGEVWSLNQFFTTLG